MARHGSTSHKYPTTSQNKFVGDYLLRKKEINENKCFVCLVAESAPNALRSAFTTLMGNYQMVCLILMLIILSVQLRSSSPKLQVNDKMQEIQSALEVISTEVNHAGKLTKQMAEEVYLLYYNVTESGLNDEPHEEPKKTKPYQVKVLDHAVTMDSKLDSKC